MTAGGDTILKRFRRRPYKAVNVNKVHKTSSSELYFKYSAEKRPRGRPRKSNFASNTVSVNFKVNTEIALNNRSPVVPNKKPRGRPPKAKFIQLTQKRRGRPPKNSNATSKTFVNTNPNKSFANNENKTFVNSLIAINVAILLKSLNKDYRQQCFFGALDSVEHNTSNTLMSMGIKKSSILLVQNVPTIANHHSNSSFAVHSGTLEDFASNKNDELYRQKNQSWRTFPCLGWYFDTCGMIKTQKKGILDTIKKSNLVDGSILGFTFCRGRISAKKYEEEKSNFIRELRGFLEWKGFELNLDPTYDHNYSGQFVFKSSSGTPMNSFVCSARKNIK